MQIIKDLLHNYVLVSAALGWFLAQILKIFTGIFHERSFSVQALLFGSGGMPSSHSATVMALVTSSFLRYGAASFQFAVSVVLAVVVMRDASSVRLEAGKHAKVLNQIVHELFTATDAEQQQSDLKELLGHTPLQVFVGALLGLIIALSLWPLYQGMLA